MKTLITGVGSCGTTFLARLFMELGCDLGDDLNAIDRPRGMEHRPLAQLLTDWDMSASPYPMPAYKVDHKDVGGATIEEFFRFRDQVLNVTDFPLLPDIVKSPLMPHWLHTWLRAGGTKPEVVIVCSRPLRDTAASFVRHAKWLEYYSLYMWQATRLGLLWDTIQEAHIPHVIVEYPRMIHDTAYLWQRLYSCTDKISSLQEFTKAHNAIADPKLVGNYGNS